MIDKAATILKPIQTQFRAARLLCCRNLVPTLIAVVALSSQTSAIILPVSPSQLFVPVPNASAAASVLVEPFFTKSYAQVATWVLPPTVIPMSGELKLKEFSDEAGNNDDEDSAIKQKRKRSSPLTIRASERQKDLLRQKAWEAGVSVGGYMLAVSLGADYKPPVDKERTQVLLALYREFRAQGNNLNQIAKHLNSGGARGETESMLGIIARSMLQTHKAIRDALAQGEPEPSP